MNFLAHSSEAGSQQFCKTAETACLHFSPGLRPIYLNFNQRQLENHGEREMAACARQGDRCRQSGTGEEGECFEKGVRVELQRFWKPKVLPRQHSSLQENRREVVRRGGRVVGWAGKTVASASDGIGGAGAVTVPPV